MRLSLWRKILEQFKATKTSEDLTSLRSKFIEVACRLHNDFLNRGWVISRQDGKPEHMGDSLLWTGIAMGVGGNVVGHACMDALRKCLVDYRGALFRYLPYELPDEYTKREISFDGEAGFIFGMAARISKYPDDVPVLTEMWRMRRNFIESRGGELFPKTNAFIPLPFEYAVDLISWKLGLGKRPPKAGKRLLEESVWMWSAVTNASRKSAYRVHLAFLMIMVCELLGDPVSDKCRDLMRLATTGMDIPLIDWWVGRRDAKTWLETFKYDEWEYRHQRGGYEGADGRPGLRTPGLDFLVMFDLATRQL